MKTLFEKIGARLKAQDNPDTYLIAGLGNPGREYLNNRHNVGFMVVDEIAKQLGVEFSRLQSQAMVTKAEYAGKKIILAKPRTFMNNSGQAVAALVRFYKIPQENILIIFDDADLPLETLRMRPSGSSSGQKGMRSVLQHLGSEEIPRLRIGVDRPPGRMKTPDYVLQDFSKTQQVVLPFILRRACEAALLFVAAGIVTAMNQYNGSEA